MPNERPMDIIDAFALARAIHKRDRVTALLFDRGRPGRLDPTTEIPDDVVLHYAEEYAKAQDEIDSIVTMTQPVRGRAYDRA